MSRTRKLVIVIVGIIALLSIVQVTVSNIVSTDGIALDSIEHQTIDMKRENALLKEEVYTDSSLTHLAGIVDNLGFLDKTTEVYINSSLPIASR